MAESSKPIEVASKEFADRISSCLRTAKVEEDLRIESEKTLDPLLRSIGVEPKPRYERLGDKAKATYSHLRPDAVHGRVIIEYEPPKSLGRKAALEHAEDQVWGYLAAESTGLNRDPRVALPHMAGIGFDGERIFFVRFNRRSQESGPVKKAEFLFDGPYPFDVDTARTFLTSLRSLSRLPLTAEYLAQAFGPEQGGRLAAQAVSALVRTLTSSKSDRVKVFFGEWKRLFGIVYGEQFTNYRGGESVELAKAYGVPESVDFQSLLFCVHTYFAFLMKLIAAELLTLRESDYASSYSARLVHASRDKLAEELNYIEDGSVFAQRGISNFIEGDFFRWYTDCLTSDTETAIKDIARSLAGFEPATSTIDPASAHDLLKTLYQYLLPRAVRHRLGEYYTPDWLAELLLDRTGYSGGPESRILDPACGSGTFLVLAIQRIRQAAKKDGESETAILQSIVKNVWGFDLNPLAVIASRTNYLFALGGRADLLGDFEIPVYLADSVLWPEISGQTRLDRSPGESLVTTSVGTFHVPSWWLEDKGQRIRIASTIIERAVKDHYPVPEILERLRAAGLVDPKLESVVQAFCSELATLEEQGKNGIWVRFLKNTFAPILADEFDYVVGNPPWIRWGYLSREYRAATERLWNEYGLFSLKGYEARLGGGEKDFSMLFTYSCADNYLKDRGILGFLLTRETVKSTGAGEGFRRFLIGKRSARRDPTPLEVLQAGDLASVQPFEGAANKTSFLVLRKGTPTHYPLPYTVWKKRKGVGRIPTDLTWTEAAPLLEASVLEAKPIGKPTGPWQTVLHGSRTPARLKGVNPYRFIIGARCEPYGVFWVEVREVLRDGTVIIKNLADAGKREVASTEERIEPDLVFPVVRGGDVHRWHAEPHVFSIIPQDPQTKAGYGETLMRTKWPKTYHYLSRFKPLLLSRAAYRKYHEEQAHPFYSQYNISNDTFRPYRVVIKRMASDLQACVVSEVQTPMGKKPVIPLDTTTVVPLDSRAEAHYVCGVLNSAAAGDYLRTFASAGRGFATPSILRLIGMPRYDRTQEVHQAISHTSERLHRAAPSDDTHLAETLENEINALARKVLKA